LPEVLLGQLNYTSLDPLVRFEDFFHAVHGAPWNKETMIQKNFSILKLQRPLQDADLEPNRFDLIYYDAFAPSRQPEMWNINSIGKLANAMRAGAALVTYCAKGQFKRDLRSVGLKVETMAGPPGKKEMVRAVK